jgi:NAD-dependent deacetylase
MKHPIRSVAVLTGAGISAESGINTFRAKDGLWENHRVEDVATPDAFVRDPDLVHRFYNARRRFHEGNGQDLRPAEPNRGHLALASFERRFDGQFLLITQNVDALHEKAGSQNVLHMHGELLKMRCAITGEVYAWTSDCSPQSVCDCCDKPGTLRPHIVWFGEVPFYLDAIERALVDCDLFVSVGTSGNVYPAAGFFQVARATGAHTVELNLEPSQNASAFDEGHYGPGTEVIPHYFETLLSEGSLSLG